MIYDALFERKLISVNGNEFQHYFFEIMKCTYKDNFQMPRTQGRKGDKKNDGYLPLEKTYFAVYGPETLDIDITYTKSKLNSDFMGLIENIKLGEWKSPVEKFVFVLNTRNSDITYVEILQECERLREETGINVVLWTKYDLKQLFIRLDEPVKNSILNFYCSTNESFSLNAKVLNNIIQMAGKEVFLKSKIDGFLDFEEKIKFNHISDERGCDLQSASYNIMGLNDFLNKYDATGYVQEELGCFLNNLYEEAKSIFSEENQMFDYILFKMIETDNELLNDINMKVIKETSLIIMSKYFENCTIFEKKSGDNA